MLLSPPQTRAVDPAFVQQCSIAGLVDRLPLDWPTPAQTPLSPKRKYRSQYRYLGFDDLLDPNWTEQLSSFDLLLRLIDFEGLRPVLAERLGWKSARGKVPFDPISLFLLHGWQLTNRWSRAEVLRQLKKEKNADYARRFGFIDQDFPSEGGLRYVLTRLGEPSDLDGLTTAFETADGHSEAITVQGLNQLIIQSIDLIRQTGVLSDQAWEQALICPDGMIHHAASNKRCGYVSHTCYQPTTPQQPRPCPAQEHGKQGCDCQHLSCQDRCHFAPAWDQPARVVLYAGANQPANSPNQNRTAPSQPGRNKVFYGYRSMPLQLADPQRRFSLVLLDHFQPANLREEVPATALIQQLRYSYPDLALWGVAGDAAFGFDLTLAAIYDLGAKRLVDLRAHETDQDKTLWPLRGYDDRGRPICQFGYALTANGFDPKKQRQKWGCNQACTKGTAPVVELELVDYPPTECPFRRAQRPHGQVINVAKTFDDGSIRLVRDVPVGSKAWKKSYHRARNAVEGRNATFQAWHLKRLPVFGLPRAQATIFLADVWLNLTTLARLIREASLAAQTLCERLKSPISPTHPRR